MPIYEYRCDECQELFEKLVRSSTTADEIQCPKCGSKQVKKAISLFGVGAGARPVASSAGSDGASCGST